MLTDFPSPYNLNAWRRLRLQLLLDNPRCVICHAWSSCVDHVVPWNWGRVHLLCLFYNPENLRVLCKSCHCRKTGFEHRSYRVWRTFYAEVLTCQQKRYLARLEGLLMMHLKFELKTLRAENHLLEKLSVAKTISPLNQLSLLRND